MTDYLDEPVMVSASHPLRLSADAMRSLTKATGRTMSELLQDDQDEANRVQVMAFAQLHRRAAAAGHLPDAAELWERAGLVEVEFQGEAVDPTEGASSGTLPPSATTGA